MSMTNEQLLEWAINKYDKAISEGKDNKGLVEMMDSPWCGGLRVNLLQRQGEEFMVAVYVYNHPTQFVTYYGLDDSPDIFYQVLKICYAMEEVFGDE